MKLNTDVRQLVKTKQAVYPTKGTMNLYFKEDRTTAPATVMLYVLFGLAVLLALAKFLVYDPLMALNRVEEQAAALAANNEAALVALADYDKIHEEYIRTIPVDGEQSNTDPLDLLELIDSQVRPYAAVTQVTVESDQAVVSFAGVTLQEAATLVSKLEQSPLVLSTYVDTAATTENTDNLVTVNVFLQLAKEVTEP